MLLGEFVEVFKHAHRNYFPVVNKEQQYVGSSFLMTYAPTFLTPNSTRW